MLKRLGGVVIGALCWAAVVSVALADEQSDLLRRKVNKGTVSIISRHKRGDRLGFHRCFDRRLSQLLAGKIDLAKRSNALRNGGRVCLGVAGVFAL